MSSNNLTLEATCCFNSKLHYPCCPLYLKYRFNTENNFVSEEALFHFLLIVSAFTLRHKIRSKILRMEDDSGR